MLNVYETYKKIGTIQNINKSTYSFISYMELKKKYNIKIKPRKYDNYFEDSILPYFQINFENKNYSYLEKDNYNLNKCLIKERYGWLFYEG